MDEEEPAWEAAIQAADEGRTKDLGDFAQYAEEGPMPAWRAELEASIRKFDASGATYWLWLLEPHIKAAEERGRREALKQHTNGLKADWGRFRGRVLQEAWEALRDAEGGPLVDGMSVINRLLESP